MFADRTAPRPIQYVIGLLKEALAWWTGELADLVPASLRRRLGALQGHLFLVLNDARVELIYDVAGRREVLARLPAAPADRDVARRAFRALRQRRREADSGVTICIPEENALRRIVALPVAAAGNLAQVVSFELDRQTPFTRDEVYSAYRVVKRDAEARQIFVELTVAQRNVVAAAMQIASDLGLDVEAVRVSGEGGIGQASPNLLPEAARRRSPRLAGRALGGLAALTAGLALAAIAIPFYRVNVEATHLVTEVADAKRTADASLKLQRDIDLALQGRNWLVDRKLQTVPISEVLRNLTELLPDDTWLVSLEVSGTEVRLSGYAASATEVLRILDRSAMFTNAAFRASVNQDPRLNREQFNIAAQIRGGKSQ